MDLALRPAQPPLLASCLVIATSCTSLTGSVIADVADASVPDVVEAGCAASRAVRFSLTSETEHAGTLGASGALADAAGGVYVYGMWVGCGGRDSAYDALVLRFGADGRLDPGFADQGRFCDGVHEGGRASNEVIESAAIDPRGRIVLAGFTTEGTSGSTGYLLRLDAQGRPDESFGPDGVRLIRVTGPEGRAIGTAFYAVSADERGITVGGGDNNPFGPSTLGFLWRLRDNGEPDERFHGGRPVFDTRGGAFRAITRAPGGYAVASTLLVNDQLRAARFTDAGELVTGFGEQGFALGPMRVMAGWVSLDAMGRLLVGGWAIDPRGGLLRVARFDANGRLDMGYGTRGVFDGTLLRFAGGGYNPQLFAAHCDGSVTFFGADLDDVAASRALPNGRLDPSLGLDGVERLPGRRIAIAATVDPRDGAPLLVTQSGVAGLVTLQRWHTPR